MLCCIFSENPLDTKESVIAVHHLIRKSLKDPEFFPTLRYTLSNFRHLFNLVIM